MQKEYHYLPDPFLFENGRRVQTKEDWNLRRKEIKDNIIELEYGGLPPAPFSTEAEELHTSAVKWMNGVKYITYRITVKSDSSAPTFNFIMDLHVPCGKGPFPVVLYGDGCWRYLTDNIIEEIMNRNIMLARFNRVELAPDVQKSGRESGIYKLYPDLKFGALSAWAWGYHRCVDVLSTMDDVDAKRIAVTGHSRGGKTVLLAGATDERIALVASNNSGSGGAGSYKFQGIGSETIAESIKRFSFWYGLELAKYEAREDELPFDQHYLKALVAPRALLTTEALGDVWANPTGTYLTYLAAREVYKFLAAEDMVGILYREGGHEHGFVDWLAFLDFMEWQLCGKDKKKDTDYEHNPFKDLPKAFTWSVPIVY